MRSDAGRPLAIAEDVVGGNIPAATRDVALSPVIDDECGVGKPSVQRFELHLAAPARERGDSCFEIYRHHSVRLMAEAIDDAKPAYRVTPGREGMTFDL
jgi:hypothetical protein